MDELRASALSKDVARTLKHVCDSLGQAISDTRTLTFDLSSPILHELGFEAAVAAWLGEQIEKKHNIKTELEDDEKPKPLDDDARVLLFRTVQELLINVVKHAQANNVKVSIRRVDDRIQVTVEDDGWGFDTTKVTSMPSTTCGFGLFSIKERLEHLGGRLEIESEPGQGSRVTVTAPLTQKKNDSEGQK